jgi:hypothetical protein
MDAGKALLAKDFQGAFKNFMEAGKHFLNPEGPAVAGTNASEAANLSASGAIAIRTALADVIQFSGCKDSQTSADAFLGGESAGAMSYSLIKALEEHGLEQTYAELLLNLRANLVGRFKQIPQLSVGHRLLDLENTTFSLGKVTPGGGGKSHSSSSTSHPYGTPKKHSKNKKKKKNDNHHEEEEEGEEEKSEEEEEKSEEEDKSEESEKSEKSEEEKKKSKKKGKKGKKSRKSAARGGSGSERDSQSKSESESESESSGSE